MMNPGGKIKKNVQCVII